MQHDSGDRVGGAWIALAAVVMASALAMHGPIAADPSDQMVRIADHASAWVLAHWLAAVGLSLHVMAGLIILTSPSALTQRVWTRSAWAALVVGGLWTVNTAVAEATVVTDAAVAGNSQVFGAWWAFAEGKANGFAFLTLSMAVIAGSDARGEPGATPSWAAWVAMTAGIASFACWGLGMWFEVGVGAILWVAFSILVSAWTAWFGFGLARFGAAVPGGR